MLPRREPDFDQLLKVLRNGRPDRPVLFDFLVDWGYLERISGDSWLDGDTEEDLIHNWVVGFAAAGYDFSTIPIGGLGMWGFPMKKRDRAKSIGMAHGGTITDRESLEDYTWPNPEVGGYHMIDVAAKFLTDGQKLILVAPGGVLECATEMVGYEDLIFFIQDDPKSAKELFDNIGSRLLRYYEKTIDHPAIGAAFVNDDWGFKTQPFFSVETMREYVFPWQVQIVECIHRAGKPAILHSCGNLEPFWGDILNVIQIDAKHSYEDVIAPVELMYERFVGRMAIVGGMDIDFLCRSTPADIEKRCRAMLERTETRGGYALGSGNSIPDYVPFESYLAMQRVGLTA